VLPTPGPPARDVDARLVARAEALRAGGLTPVRPRHSSTVLLLRDRADGIEVYVVRRRSTMAFAPGMYAFPGGSVDRRDVAEPPPSTGPTVRQWADRLGFTDAGLALASVCAAARETFEETGVLLAGPGPDRVVADTTGEEYDAARMALVGGDTSFGAFLARRGLLLRADLLAPWTRWVTPRVEERRFDTRFFLAALPAGQRARDVSGEADRVAWTRPADALAAVHAGQMRMLAPTYAALDALTPHRGVADALAAAPTDSLTGHMPEVAVEAGTARWLLPGEPGHTGAVDEGELR